MIFREITVSGTPYEMGKQFGEQCRDEIRNLLNKVLVPEKREDMLKRAMSFVELYNRYFPDMLEELYGTAEGAGITKEESVLLQTRWDLDSAPVGECTSYAIKAPASKNGRIFAGINKDVNEFSRENMVMLHMVPKNGPRKLIAAYYGSMAGPGMNEYGTCFFGNSLYGDTPSRTIPQPMMMRLILESKNTAEALERMINVSKDGLMNTCGNSTICDAKGDMCCFEHINGCFDAVRPDERGFLAHANNVISKNPELLAREHPDQSGNTFGRQRRMTELFEQNFGNIDEEVIKSVLRDHEGLPFAICRHDAVMLGRTPSCTILSFICMPAEGKALASKGNPCENEYVEYTV